MRFRNSQSCFRTRSISPRPNSARRLSRSAARWASSAAGAILVIPALVMALFALSAALIAAGWSQPVSYLTSAIVAAVIAGVLFAIGMNRLDARNLAPRETMRQLEKDKDTVKGMVR